MHNLDKIKKLLRLLPQAPDYGLTKGIKDREAVNFYTSTGLSMPSDLAEWLKIANGLFVDSQYLLGLYTERSFLDIESYFTLYPFWKTNGWIPIGGDGCGNYYLISTQNEYGSGFPVFFVDTHEEPESPSYIVASNISYFLEFLLEKELKIEKRWPFDQDYVTAKDPEILSFRNIFLPWQN